MGVFFNDNEAYVAAWLRNLYPEATVDERGIGELGAGDLAGFRRVHLFAGIGGWEYALDLAGWPEGGEIWTGSCPCQPFSQAGKQRGESDERHLWPEMRRLIALCRPATVFGEQVASKLGREWLSGVRADLEGLGYAVGAADLCAASAGAPHIRQRLYWGAVRVADGNGSGSAVIERRQRSPRQEWECEPVRRSASWMDDTDGTRLNGTNARLPGWQPREGCVTHPGSGRWSEYEVVTGSDGLPRRTQPGVLPLADGIPDRVGRIRALGNSVVPQVAASFVRAFKESIHALES